MLFTMKITISNIETIKMKVVPVSIFPLLSTFENMK